MNTRTVVAILFFGLVALVSTSFAFGNGETDGKVLLRDITALTLRPNRMTNGRRTAAVPQMKCVGGSAKCQHEPELIQCKNVGFDGYDVQWECSSTLPNEYRLVETNVYCEGYEYPDDPYVLRGIYGVEYTMDYNPAAQAGHSHYDSSHRYTHSNYHANSGGIGSSIASFLFTAFFVFVIYKMCCGGRAHPMNMNPPPYSSGPAGYPNNGFTSGFGNPGYGGYGYGSTAPGSGPGFWSGMGLGGLLGNMWGGRRNYNNAYGYNNGYNTGYGNRFYGSGRSGFGGGSSGGSAPSGGSSSSTGHGGTRRR